MDETQERQTPVVTRPVKWYHFIIALTIIWTAGIFASLAWNIEEGRRRTLEVARIQARAAFTKDVLYRAWNSSHGGVYAPVTEATPPNPYLDVEERDIVTPSGKTLTLVNPSYMTRQVHEMGEMDTQIHGHITSLNPIRPANAPDPWERRALLTFENGASEASSVENLDGEPHMRLMRPLFVEPACMKCHAKQGYEVGEVRGGISNSLSMAPFFAIESDRQLVLWKVFVPLWLVGLAGIGFAFAGIRGRVRERDAAMEELTRARHAAESANRAKDQFLANMSHEIRTPLNGVIGFTDMLLDTRLDAGQGECAAAIRRSGEMLLSLINDVLDFSKLDTGDLTLDEVDFDPESLAEDVCEMITPRVESKSVEVLCTVDASVPRLLRGDPLRVRQVLVNLMGNAVKFTHAGEVEMLLSVDREEEGKVLLRATVRDTGPGIPPDRIGSIFSPFTQVDGSMTRQYGGTGLGLSISRTIARRMGGDLWAESRPGEGSTFHFTAWLARSGEREEGRHCPVFLSGRRCLVVDDNARNLEVLSAALAWAGVSSTRLDGGGEALNELRRAHEAGEPYDVCICDVQMPGITGQEVARRIRDSGEPFSNIPLVALSSLSERDAKKCEEAGFDGFLNKPVRRRKLFSLLERVMGRVREDEDSERIITHYSPWKSTSPRSRVLLVEDHPVNQKLTGMMLKKAGHLVRVADDGAEAVDVLREAPDAFDIVFMDLQMPRMDGYEATRRLREMGIVLPVVAMTAHALAGTREACHEAGMDDYVTKPVQTRELLMAVDKWTTACPTAGPVVCAGADLNDRDPGEAAGGREEPESDWVYDRSELLRRLGGDNDLLNELLGMYRDSLPEHGEALAEAIERRDAASFASNAHKLKGVSANLGIDPLRALAARMEQAGNSGDIGEATRLLGLYEKEMDRFLQASREK